MCAYRVDRYGPGGVDVLQADRDGPRDQLYSRLE